MACNGQYTAEIDGQQCCEYCGSLSPKAAIELLKKPGTRFSGADWKYGWPHKFYIEPLNEKLDEKFEVSTRDGDGTVAEDYWSCFAHQRKECSCPKEVGVTGHWSRPEYGVRKHLHFKFYATHLTGSTDEQLQEWTAVSEKWFGIKWGRDEQGVWYRAPQSNSFYGYQQAGETNAQGEPGRAAE